MLDLVIGVRHARLRTAAPWTVATFIVIVPARLWPAVERYSKASTMHAVPRRHL